MNGITALTVEEVIDIHEALTRDFEASNDPISPPGIKNRGLLESAIARQHSGFGGFLKYKTPELNAATLCYGVCCNHALHNGNKRTAMVAMLCHLDKNGLTFNEKANQDDLYRFMVKVAAHRFRPKRTKGDGSDGEVQEIARWIKKRTRKVQKSERIVTYRELEKRLKKFDVVFERDSGNYANVFRTFPVEKRSGFFGQKRVTVPERRFLANVPYYQDGRHVGKKLIRTIRKNGELTPEHGVDSNLFYGDETSTDEFIMKYKKTLRRLART